MADKKDPLRKLVDRLLQAKREFNRRMSEEMGDDADEDEGPPPPAKPATPKQLAALEKKLGKPLPPSYRAFLELHNGWVDFDGDGRLLSTEDHAKPKVKKRVKELSGQFEEWGGDDPFEAGCLPVMIGYDISNYLVLDPSKVSSTGEMEFVLFDMTEKERRFKDFTSFLKWDLQVMEGPKRKKKRGKKR